MAKPDAKPPRGQRRAPPRAEAERPVPRRWGTAAIGGLLVAVGGALFGASRASKPGAVAKPAAGPRPAAKGGRAETRPAAAPRPRRPASRPAVRTKPDAPEVTAPTRYWPPPPPKPADVFDDGIRAPEQALDGPHGKVDAASERLGYERFDAKPGTIVTVMLSSVAFIVCCIAGLFYLIGAQHRDDVLGPPLTRQQLTVIVPPGPHLQDHPLHDIAMENEREFDRLKYYGWTDPQHTAARIPISRAQALVIGRPLDPLPSAGAQPPGGPAAAPVAPAPASNP